MELFKSRPRVAYTNKAGDKVYPVVVDIKKGIKSTEDIQFVSSDVNTGILSVAFIQGNDNYNVTGADVVCSVMRPDASTLELPCEVVGENIVEVPLGINGTSQDGVYSFDFKVFKGENKVVGTPIMSYSVSLSIDNDMVVEEDDRLPVLTVLMTQLTELKDEARESINQANTATVASREATANAIEATNNANAVSERVSQETSEAISRVDNKVNEVETRFNALTTSQQQSSEVIDARDGETSLKVRLDRDIEKAKQVYVELEGSYISTESSTGAIEDLEILGNTVQDPNNLSDIKSVGELQEDGTYKMSILSCGKNLFNPFSSSYEYSLTNGLTKVGHTTNEDGSITVSSKGSYDWGFVEYQNITVPKDITMSFIPNGVVTKGNASIWIFEANGTKICEGANTRISFISTTGKINVRLYVQTTTSYSDAKITYKPYLTEGTVATPYEPYQGNKCDILLPCQLEKVGDVSDRLYYDDVEKAWCIEKNVGTVVLEGNENWSYRQDNGNFKIYQVALSIKTKSQYDSNLITNKYISLASWTEQKEFCFINEYNGLIVNSSLDTVENFKNSLNSNSLIIKYQKQSKDIEKIILPLDVQIQLNSFFGTTHIYMESGEVEGTIKCKIPKSLGATVQSLNNKTDILSDRVSAIEGLKDSQNMKYETDKGYLVCKETKNGVIDDLKIEGKTLVNLAKNTRITRSNTVGDFHIGDFGTCFDFPIDANKEYTFIINVLKNTSGVNLTMNDTGAYANFVFPRINSLVNGLNVLKLKVKENATITQNSYWGTIGLRNSTTIGDIDVEATILEGDHTQNPPSYFEGLMSVGEDVDKIEVLSRKEDGNLFDEKEFVKHINTCDSSAKQFTENNKRVIQFNNISTHEKPFMRNNFKPNTKYTFSMECKNTEGSVIYLACSYTDGTTGIIGQTSSTTYTTIQGSSDASKTIEYMYISYGLGGGCAVVLDNFLVKQGTSTTYEPLKQDKKQILFYNENGELEPIQELHEWDSIEKHSDNKWYYHKRSGKVVLNGSENWFLYSGVNLEQTLLFGLTLDNYLKWLGNNTLLADKIKCNVEILDDVEGIFNKNSHINYNTIGFKILKSKLSTQDVEGFKQWLQANNVTVVYQLEQEKVYEIAPLHLDSYANETLILCNSGAISPKMEFSITSHINELVKSQGDRISLLEEKMYKALKQVLAGDMYSLAELLYPEDFVEENPENEIMLIPFE